MGWRSRGIYRMREIKFKVWWPDAKDFMPFWESNIDYDSFVHCGYTLEDYPNDEFIILRYTGLKDKNSKEVYEGDIIRHRDNLKGIIKFGEFIRYDEYGEVEFLGFYIHYPDQKIYRNKKWWNYIESDISILEACKFEIIGNIYENPELLNEET